MEKTSAIQREKLQKLHDVVARKKKLLILTHDNPDPDGLAAAFALRYLISTLWDMEGAIAYGGHDRKGGKPGDGQVSENGHQADIGSALQEF